MDQKSSQRQIYNQGLLGDLKAGLGTQGFSKIKSFKDVAIYGFIRRLKVKKGEKVLDVGCNGGELLNKVVGTYEAEGYGLDISDKTIEIAKEHNPFQNQYIVGDAENLPYPDRSFDVVISTDVLEHVPSPQKVLSEIGRVLKPRGRFFIYCISRRNRATVRHLMQVFNHPHAWGDLGDHRQEFLVDPAIFNNPAGLKVRRKFYFQSFFLYFADEFLIRPMLYLAVLARGKRNAADKNLVIHPQGKTRPSGLRLIYFWFLTLVFWLLFILDLSWYLFKSSDAILVYGQKI
jgi:SAM-dependent methyltransferase